MLSLLVCAIDGMLGVDVSFDFSGMASFFANATGGVSMRTLNVLGASGVRRCDFDGVSVGGGISTVSRSPLLGPNFCLFGVLTFSAPSPLSIRLAGVFTSFGVASSAISALLSVRRV